MGGKVNLGKTGEYGNVNFSEFKGGIKKSDLKNPEQIKLFEKLDKDNNGILTQNEIQSLLDSLGNYAEDGKITKKEAKKFIKANGLKGDVKKEEVFEMLKQLGIASENVEKTYNSLWDDENVITKNVKYKPNENGEVVTEFYNEENGKLYAKQTEGNNKTRLEKFYPNGELREAFTEEADGTTSTFTYNELGNVSKEVTKTPDGWTTTVTCNEGEPSLTTRKRSAVTQYLNKNGKVIKQEVDKGLGGVVVTEYNYDEQGNLISSTTTKPDGTVVTEGGEPEQKVTPEQVERQDSQEPQEPQEYKLKVNYQDTWYGIVQAKYGITDHRTIMEIVRQLKQQNNVNPNATNMPSEITLPASISLKNGETVELKDIDAEVDKSHWGYKTTSETGRYTITQNGETKYYAADGTELKQSCFEAKEASQDKRNVSENGSGRYSYTASNGETWYFDADGTPITKEYYEKRESEYTAVNAQKNISQNAREAFEQQLKTDGWAGKTADAVSVLWGSENRAEKVEADLQKYENQVKALQEAQSKGSQAFDAKFKEVFGVEYNPANIAEYEANPTDENYKKAFGTKNDIHKRVMDYNISQQKGAKAVKTTVVVAGSVAAGIATGGSSLLVEAAVVGAATTAGVVLTETTDLATNDIDGDVKENIGDITKGALIDGTVAAVTAGTLRGASSLLRGGSKAVQTEQGLVRASQQTEQGLVKASSRAKSATGNTGSAGSSARAGSAGAATGENATLNFVNNISSKVSERNGGGIHSLNGEEISKLAKLLDIPPQELGNMTIATYRKLTLKFHPDKLSRASETEKAIGEELYRIVNNIYKHI